MYAGAEWSRWSPSGSWSPTEWPSSCTAAQAAKTHWEQLVHSYVVKDKLHPHKTSNTLCWTFSSLQRSNSLSFQHQFFCCCYHQSWSQNVLVFARKTGVIIQTPLTGHGMYEYVVLDWNKCVVYVMLYFCFHPQMQGSEIKPPVLW